MEENEEDNFKNDGITVNRNLGAGDEAKALLQATMLDTTGAGSTTGCCWYGRSFNDTTTTAAAAWVAGGFAFAACDGG